jgi:integrase/recombinase XerD
MTLMEGVNAYVQRKRINGLAFDKGSKDLHGFCRHVGDLLMTEVTSKHISTFLNGPRTSVVTWRAKHSLLRHFLEFWTSRNVMSALMMPQLIPPVPQTFVSHIYTRVEIRTMIRAIRENQKHCHCTLHQQTLRAALLVLYGTGARAGEISRLLLRDIDVKKGYLTIRGGRFGRSRRIPVGRDLRKIIKSYLVFRSRRCPTVDHLFVTRNGCPVTTQCLRRGFQRLRKWAGVSGKNGSACPPRMHDLRSTFAVHRITAWIRLGADLNRMLPALSVYMGFAGLTATERFLFLTPERFRKELDKLSPGRSKRRWRNDPALMEFLESL